MFSKSLYVQKGFLQQKIFVKDLPYSSAANLETEARITRILTNGTRRRDPVTDMLKEMQLNLTIFLRDGEKKNVKKMYTYFLDKQIFLVKCHSIVWLSFAVMDKLEYLPSF